MDHDELDNAAYHALAYCNDIVIGTARLFLGENHSGCIARVAVVKNHRKSGVGIKLVKSLENQAKQIDIETITIFAHEHMKSYYEYLGYSYVEALSLGISWLRRVRY